MIYIAAGSVVGLMAGFDFAFLMGFIDYKIYDVPSVEAATGIACLAAIPASDFFGQTLKWKSVFIDDPHSSNAEAIRNLRASILLLGRPEHHRTLLLTSSVPGEGKTTIAAELAIAFSLNQERTLLIDFNLRRPRMSELFPQTKGKSEIVDVLSGQADIKDAIHQSVILVVRASKVPIGAVIRASSLLTESDAKVAGLVLNGMKRKALTPGYKGYKGYGEYGSEGYYGEDNV